MTTTTTSSFHAIIVDETPFWNLGEMSKYLKGMRAVYAADNAKTFCCSLSPSSWCEFLHSIPEFNEEFAALSFDERDVIMEKVEQMLCEADHSADFSHYRDWHEVQRMVKEQNAPSLTGERADVIEFWSHNYPFNANNPRFI